MKKTIFLIERTNDLRFFASIIESFQDKGKKIELVYFNIYENSKGFKYYLNPKNLKTKTIAKIKIIKIENKIKLHNFFLKNIKDISFIFSLTFLSNKRFLITTQFLKIIDKKWCVVSHGQDSFSQFKDEDTYINYSPNFFFSSKSLFKEGKEYLKNFSKGKNILDANKTKIYFVGNTMFSKKVFSKKPNKKKSLIYLPFPFLRERYKNNFAFQAAYSGKDIDYFLYSRKLHKKSLTKSILSQIKHNLLNIIEIIKHYKSIKNYYLFENELNVIKTIKKFCDKNNYEFIVKPRFKFPHIKHLGKYADKVISDNEEQQYPNLLQSEMSKADLVIGSLSSSVFESAMFKIPYINIEIPKIAFISKVDSFFHNYSAEHYYNFKGVVFNYKIKDFINHFYKESQSNLKIDFKRNNTYLKKFCGLEKNSKDCGEKIYKILHIGRK